MWRDELIIPRLDSRLVFHIIRFILTLRVLWTQPNRFILTLVDFAARVLQCTEPFYRICCHRIMLQMLPSPLTLAGLYINRPQCRAYIHNVAHGAQDPGPDLASWKMCIQINIQSNYIFFMDFMKLPLYKFWRWLGTGADKPAPSTYAHVFVSRLVTSWLIILSWWLCLLYLWNPFVFGAGVDVLELQNSIAVPWTMWPMGPGTQALTEPHRKCVSKSIYDPTTCSLWTSGSCLYTSSDDRLELVPTGRRQVHVRICLCLVSWYHYW